MKMILWTALAVALMGCGSPEKYAKQDSQADSADGQATVGFRLGDEYSEWARGLSSANQRSHAAFDMADTVRALTIVDSLIRYAESSLDTIPFHDVRSKYLILTLTDLHTQAIRWEQSAGHTSCVERRTAQFQTFADRIKRDKAAAPTP